MTERLTETAMREKLERFGALERARQGGVYVIRLAETSDDANEVLRAWSKHIQADVPAGLGQRFAAADRLLYVGSHGKSMYKRVCEHAADHKSSTIMTVWPPVELVGLYPASNPDTKEYNRAVALSNDTTAVWTDGEYL